MWIGCGAFSVVRKTKSSVFASPPRCAGDDSFSSSVVRSRSLKLLLLLPLPRVSDSSARDPGVGYELMRSLFGIALLLPCALLAQPAESNVVFGTYSGLALLMDLQACFT